MLRYCTAVAIAAACLAIPVNAQSILTEDRAIQMRLRQEGLLPGRPDGKFGPASRAAMAKYAEKYEIDDSRDAVIENMVKLPFENAVDLTDPMKEAVEREIRALQLDPDAAQITFDTSYMILAGPTVVCGTVNGKNLYGAYVGHQAYQASLTTLDIVLVHIDDNDAKLACALGTSMSYALRN